MPNFEFAYSLDAKANQSVVDLPIDTTANFAQANRTKGQLVVLVSGLVRQAATGASAVGAIGVLEGEEFTGLVAQGQPYAATNASQTASVTDATAFPNGIAKIRRSKEAVYRAVGSVAAANAHIGGKYGITTTGAAQVVNIADTTNQVVEVVEVDIANNILYVKLI